MGNDALVERIAAIILEHRDADVRDVARLIVALIKKEMTESAVNHDLA